MMMKIYRTVLTMMIPAGLLSQNSQATRGIFQTVEMSERSYLEEQS